MADTGLGSSARIALSTALAVTLLAGYGDDGWPGAHANLADGLGPHVWPRDMADGESLGSQGAGGWSVFDGRGVPLTRDAGGRYRLAEGEAPWNAASCGVHDVKGPLRLVFDTRTSADLGPGSVGPAWLLVGGAYPHDGPVPVPRCWAAALAAGPDGRMDLADAVVLEVRVADPDWLPRGDWLGISAWAEVDTATVLSDARPYLVLEFDTADSGERAGLDLRACTRVSSWPTWEFEPDPLADAIVAYQRVEPRWWAPPPSPDVLLLAPDDGVIAASGGEPPEFVWRVEGAPCTTPQERARVHVDWACDSEFLARPRGRFSFALRDAASTREGRFAPARRTWRRIVRAAQAHEAVFWRVRVTWTTRERAPGFSSCDWYTGVCHSNDGYGYWQKHSLPSQTRRFVGP